MHIICQMAKAVLSHVVSETLVKDHFAHSIVKYFYLKVLSQDHSLHVCMYVCMYFYFFSSSLLVYLFHRPSTVHMTISF